MKFSEVAKLVKDIPYTQEERGKKLYDHILKNKPKDCIELGFAHGVASCYMAAALDEIGSGTLTCVDLLQSEELSPNLETLIENTPLQTYISIQREVNSYTWFLQKEITKNTFNYSCNPIYDLCFIDGPKNWTIDGLGFFLIDKLLKEEGNIVFDDYKWKYSEYSKSILDGITVRGLSEDQANTPNIELVFQLLVMQHPNYSDFVIDEDWAWAKKIKSDKKTVRIEASQSIKYRLLKKLRNLI